MSPSISFGRPQHMPVQHAQNDDAPVTLNLIDNHIRKPGYDKSPLGNNLPTFLAAACSSILREIDQDAG
jgi:hypothetical protein